MVKFIPPYCGNEVKSNAERKIFEILKKFDAEQGYVLHSLGLPRHQSKIYGEIDFVVVCERGVACLEVKGGGVECRNGKWYFRDRYGVEREKTEGPFAQVIGNMFSLKKILMERFGKYPGMKDMLLACGVMFPDIEFKSRSIESVPEIVYDKRSGDVTAYINQIFDYWEGRQHEAPRCLSLKNRQDVTDFLRVDFTYVPSLGERLDEVDKRLLRLTREQAVLLDALSMNDHLLIEGGAGTGKTMLAMEYARRECDIGRKVLYLTYNKNLAHDIAKRLEEQCHGSVKVINLHALLGEYVEVDIEAMKQNPNQYFTTALPEDALSYLAALSERELGDLQYDILIVDEGQDILRPSYLFVMDALLRGGLEKGRWAVFYDEKQNLYNPEFTDGYEFLSLFFHTRFKLFINCRNTAQIGRFNAKISGTELGEFLQENGEEVREIFFSGETDFKAKISEILKRLKKEGVALNDLVFLSPKRLKNSRLSLMDPEKFQVNELGSSPQIKENVPVYSTIQGFKGMDAKVVIILDLDKIPEAMYSPYVYTGCSRARSLLIVMIQDRGEMKI